LTPVGSARLLRRRLGARVDVPFDLQRHRQPAVTAVKTHLDLGQLKRVKDQIDLAARQLRIDLVGVARQGGRAAFVDDLESGARSDLVRKGWIVAVRHHRKVVVRPAGRMKTARGTPAGLTDVPFALVYVAGSA
jgi:hypothetical protein